MIHEKNAFTILSVFKLLNCYKNLVLYLNQRTVEFLGHILDSEHIELPEKKRRIVLQECKKHYNNEKGKLVKIRTVARVIGLIVSSFSAVDHGLLQYRELEKAKSEA